MPVQNIGDKIPLDRSDLFVQLKSKGEKITFRLAQPIYTYDAKHFSEGKDGKWTVSECLRIMQDKDCYSCEKYFEIAKQIKELKNSKAKGNADKIKELDSLARKYKAKVTFYYAILNREEKQAQIIQVPLMIRLKIEELFNNGFKVVDSDFIMIRTEKPGNEYYSFLRKDSEDTQLLDEAEEKEMEKARKFNIEELTLAKKGSHTFEEPPTPEEP